MIVRLRVAALTLAARSQEALPGLRLHPRQKPFSVTRGADILLEATSSDPPDPAAGACLFDSGGLWSVHRHGRGRLYVVREPLAGRRPLKAALLDEGLRRGTLYVPKSPQSGKPGFALGFPLDEVLFQHRLAGEGGLFVHAAAVVVGEGVALFCGVSGAGKTTLARLFHRAGRRVLSDDRVALRPRGRTVRAWGTPWHGSGRFASPGSARLRAVFFLKKASRSEAVPLRAAPTRLFSLAFPPLWDETGVVSVLAACGRVAEAVPAFELRFRKDASALRAVEEALARSRR